MRGASRAGPKGWGISKCWQIEGPGRDPSAFGRSVDSKLVQLGVGRRDCFQPRGSLAPWLSLV
eukprot:10922646-Alexandrium_andersonii.AAC.1